MTPPTMDPRHRLRRRLGVGALALGVTAAAGTGALVAVIATGATGQASTTTGSTQATDGLQSTSAPEAATGHQRHADSGGS